MSGFEVKTPSLKKASDLANAVIDGVLNGALDRKLAKEAIKASEAAGKATGEHLMARLSRRPEAAAKSVEKLAKAVDQAETMTAEIKSRAPAPAPEPANPQRQIDVGSILPSFHARPIDESKVAELAASIRDVGLINPIAVRAVTRHRGGAPYQAFEIVAGHHRHAAAKSLGWATVSCMVVALDDLHAELAELDENLIRLQLSPAQEAIAISRRKAIHETLHPETKAEAFKGNRHTGSLASDKLSFATATAEATGKNERTIERAAARGDALGEDLKAVQGTSLDKGVELDALAKMPAEERAPLIESAKAGETVSARKAGAGRAPKAGAGGAAPAIGEVETRRGATSAEVEALMKAWNKAGGEARKTFLARIGR